jgi:uncharacterized protein YgiM (DUF1202 family)
MRRISGLIIILSLVTLTAYAQEEAKEKFPKTGYAKDNSAIVRAGDNDNFENLCTLSKSDFVKIIDRRYSWFKILLPRKAALYVSKDYVALTSDEKGIGIINASNVNLRAGAGTRYSIVGQISKPEKVSILSEETEWYKIEPPYGTTGWVLSSQIILAEEEAEEEGQANNPEQKSAAKEVKEEKAAPLVPAVVQKKETTGSVIVRLGADYPSPNGNLSISTSTKNNR